MSVRGDSVDTLCNIVQKRCAQLGRRRLLVFDVLFAMGRLLFHSVLAFPRVCLHLTQSLRAFLSRQSFPGFADLNVLASQVLLFFFLFPDQFFVWTDVSIAHVDGRGSL